MTFAGNPSSNRYEFGANWASFIDKHYSAERRRMAAEKLLSFLGKQTLEGFHSSISAAAADCTRLPPSMQKRMGYSPSTLTRSR